MIGNLKESQIDELLQVGTVGRIGCYTNGTVYVVPTSYAYHQGVIYAHTYEGMKITAMRQNPEVCFEVDDFRNMANWQSVIAWGKFEECNNPVDRNAALKILLDRPFTFISSITTHLGMSWPFYPEDIDRIDGIVYRIVLHKKTGKFESTNVSPHVSG